MFKILLALLLLSTPAWATQWRAGTGEQTILGTSQAALIGYNSYNSIVSPLDSLLATYCNQYLTYNSGNNINVSAGSVMVSNSQGTIRLMLQNTSISVVNFTNIDTGVEAPSTTYYIYAVAATNAATSATYYISASNTAPSGQTYYYQLGSFFNDANSNITNIVDYSHNYNMGTPSAKSVGVVYQALTDGYVEGNTTANSTTNNITFTAVSDSNPAPTTVVQYGQGIWVSGAPGQSMPIFFHVQRGNYYKVTSPAGATINFVPHGQ